MNIKCLMSEPGQSCDHIYEGEYCGLSRDKCALQGYEQPLNSDMNRGELEKLRRKITLTRWEYKLIDADGKEHWLTIKGLMQRPEVTISRKCLAIRVGNFFSKTKDKTYKKHMKYTSIMELISSPATRNNHNTKGRPIGKKSIDMSQLNSLFPIPGKL